MSGIRTPGVERLQAPEAIAPPRTTSTARCARSGWRTSSARRRCKDQLGVFIEAARARGEALDHVLLAGPPGPGQDLAGADRGQRARGRRSWPPPGPALERKGDVASYLSSLEPRSVFFVDEIHRLPRALEETFYPAMEDRRLPITVGQGAGARVVNLDLPTFTLIGATTRAGLLTTPLRDRFGVTHRLELYGPGTWADRAPLGGHPRRGDRRRRAPRRSPPARAARRAWPTGCSSACATSPRCAAPGAIDAGVAAEALDLLEVDAPGPRPPRPRDPAHDLREVRRRAGGPVHPGRGGRRGAGHRRGRLRALPAPAGPDHAHAARARGHPGGLRAPGARAPPAAAESLFRTAPRSDAAPLANLRRVPNFICPNCGNRSVSTERTAGFATARAGARSAASASSSSCSTTTTRRPTRRSSSATSRAA